MATIEDVQGFLNDFKEKAKVFDIVYYGRQINNETLLNLGISAQIREDLIMNITFRDYYRGPLRDKDPERPDFYEFGITFRGQEIYIKLSLGKFSKSPHCMSFHASKQPILYPFK
jgi:hypothetical protein